MNFDSSKLQSECRYDWYLFEQVTNENHHSATHVTNGPTLELPSRTTNFKAHGQLAIIAENRNDEDDKEEELVDVDFVVA